MIDTTTLMTKVNQYMERCNLTKHKPTYNGIGIVLGISGTTIANVVNGHFNGKEYTNTPHITRCVDNNDFDLIRALFDKRD